MYTPFCVKVKEYKKINYGKVSIKKIIWKMVGADFTQVLTKFSISVINRYFFKF